MERRSLLGWMMGLPLLTGAKAARAPDTEPSGPLQQRWLCATCHLRGLAPNASAAFAALEAHFTTIAHQERLEMAHQCAVLKGQIKRARARQREPISRYAQWYSGFTKLEGIT